MQQDVDLFNELSHILLEEEKNNPVAKPIPTTELFNALDLDLNTDGILDDELKANLASIIKSTPKTASKSFFNQLFGGRMGKATLGDLLSVMLNNSMYTYKVAGPQVGIEKIVLKNIAKLAGYPKDSDGTLAPGGSMTNMMAMLMARDLKNTNIRANGISEKMIVYTLSLIHI